MCAIAKETEELRAGSTVLSLFVNPLNAEVLRAHVGAPQRVSKLSERIDWAAETTLRTAVATLFDAGALAKSKRGSSYAVQHQLTPAGEEMLLVAEVLEAWLADAPETPIESHSKAARSAVKALTGGWSSTLMHALAAQPYSVTELAGLIPDTSYPALERQLARMRGSRQVARARGDGRSTPYVVTDWLRKSIAPLSVAGRCERRHMKDVAAPITDVEVEAAFLLTLPLVSLPATMNGTCVLAAATGAGEGTKSPSDLLAGVTVEVERGRVVACGPTVSDCPSTWGLGAPETWLDAVIDGEVGALRFGGAEPRLALALATGLHRALFGS
jgi:DNA-binding HxlR family transcriptional regulator